MTSFMLGCRKQSRDMEENWIFICTNKVGRKVVKWDVCTEAKAQEHMERLAKKFVMVERLKMSDWKDPFNFVTCVTSLCGIPTEAM